MLAYVFWHRPKAGVEPAAYENAQRSFHRALDVPSACFCLTELPFSDEGGYEDWYLVEDWPGLGRLNEIAVDEVRRAEHDRAAAMVALGWGAVYELQRGREHFPLGVEWLDKPAGLPSHSFIDSLASDSVWRRQLVLGPAPEFCAGVPPSGDREPVFQPA